MKITLEKHAYETIEINPDQLPADLRKRLENVTHDDDYESLFEELISEREDYWSYDDYTWYETVVQLENDKDMIWETLGV